MTEFIVELYVPRNDCDAAVSSAAASVRRFAAAATASHSFRGTYSSTMNSVMARRYGRVHAREIPQTHDL